MPANVAIRLNQKASKKTGAIQFLQENVESVGDTSKRRKILYHLIADTVAVSLMKGFMMLERKARRQFDAHFNFCRSLDLGEIAARELAPTVVA